MNILIICNNHGETFDGIGAYSKILSDFLSKNNSIVVFTSTCNPITNAITRIVKPGMTKCFFRSVRYLYSNKVSCIVIEYPFIEWNPLILIPFKILTILAHKKKTPIILSLHEYGRTSMLRKIITRHLAKNSDYLVVSNTQMQEELLTYCPNIFIREIPSNFSSLYETPPQKDSNQYVFLGLITKSKAFHEMIDAWCIFNVQGNKTLHIISSTYFDSIDDITKGIIFHHNISSDEIVNIMRNCAFSIIPIKPYIDEKNATLKTSYITGCIPIGVFSKEILNTFKIRIDITSLTVEAILNGLINSQNLDRNKLVEMSEESFRKGKDFSPDRIAKKFEIQLKDICLTDNRIS